MRTKLFTFLSVATLACCIGVLGPPALAHNARNVVKVPNILAITEVQLAHANLAQMDNPALPALAIPKGAIQADQEGLRAMQIPATAIAASDQTIAIAITSTHGAALLTTRPTYSPSRAFASVTAHVAFNATGTARGAPEFNLLC